MARTRNWEPRLLAEVFVRLDHGQSTAKVARLTGLSYQQVSHFEQQMRAEPSRLPSNVRTVDPETVNELHAQVAEELERERQAATVTDASGVSRRIAGTLASPEEIEAEVVGCIDLVRASAAQLGISPRRFLWLCSTHARSA